MKEVDRIAQSALEMFASEVLDGSWTGRGENEAISLFTMGYLLREVDQNGILFDPTQIGIEFRVPNVPEEGAERPKKKIRKDLVIWPEPRMSCWNKDDEPIVPPLAILEWKFNKNRIEDYDVEFLIRFTEKFPNTVGYAITANPPGKDFCLSCTRVAEGNQDSEWLHIDR